ncbi:hypothetical protein PRUPE_5G140200 [Prunus persica]|uniref:Transferring glycosyl group transferase n=1 Tax=Prunus persica TaxID=3760 RepID=M5WAF3_PRUPE|nr:uncharacterized protein At4g14100 [Prunus persica]ONI07795.1 hypothetical protein PRUPE_5G140200 [Prunus persica]
MNPREASSTMASATLPKSPSFLFFLLLLLVMRLNFPLMSKTLVESASDDPAPAAWPHQFHSVLFMNNSKGALQIVDLWYDWPNGRNFNIIQSQLGKLTYDLEWDNGTSFIYTLDANRECKTLHFPVGILRPNWLDGATYLGQRHVDGFLCNVWEKVDFIWYYEDVLTRRPVHWVFYTGFNAHVMTFEVGAVLGDAKWEAPVYCFGEEAEAERSRSRSSVLEYMTSHHSHGSSMRAGFRAT